MRGVDVGIEVPMQREARQRGRAFSDERTSSPLAQVGKSGADGLQFEKERWQETHPNREIRLLLIRESGKGNFLLLELLLYRRIYPSHRHLEQPARGGRRWQGQLSLEGLPTWKPARRHDVGGSRIYPALPDPRSTGWLSANPLLRVSLQPSARDETGPVPRTAGRWPRPKQSFGPARRKTIAAFMKRSPANP